MKNSENHKGLHDEAFVPKQLPDQKHASTGLTKVVVGFLVALFLLGGTTLFFAKTITISPTPAESQIRHLSGFSMLNGKVLYAFLGEHRLEVSAEGYETQQLSLDVNQGASPTYSVQLRELPGLVSFDLAGPDNGQLFLEGVPVGDVGTTPVEIDRGSIQYRIEHPRYLPAEGTIDVSGFGQKQSVAVAMKPNWRTVQLSSDPENASVFNDGDFLGQTPLSVDLAPDLYVLSFTKEGHKEARQLLEIELGPPIEADKVALEPLGGSLRIFSSPSDARVFIDEVYAGTSPLTFAVAADKDYAIRVEKQGYDRWTGSGTVSTNGTADISASLVQQFGTLKLDSNPAAAVYINGELQGTAPMDLNLPVADHDIELILPGFRTVSRIVAIAKNELHQINVTLLTEKDARYAEAKDVYRAQSGINMVLAKPSIFRMGAPRGEPGQMANEVEKTVSLERWFYIAETEVSHSHFASFARDMAEAIPTLRSIRGSNPNHPVTQIDWQSAALYCNWLSQQEGLPEAYILKDGKLTLDPSSVGYRLPTEAEWEWSARVAGTPKAQQNKYPWGNGATVPSGAGNFADTSATVSLPYRIPKYSDGFPDLAPVGSFSPNAMGLYDLGGNVAEWVHDYYGIELASPGNARVDPTGPENGLDHVVKGSSWRSGNETELRYSFRTFSGGPAEHIGFRIARWVH